MPDQRPVQTGNAPCGAEVRIVPSFDDVGDALHEDGDDDAEARGKQHQRQHRHGAATQPADRLVHPRPLEGHKGPQRPPRQDAQRDLQHQRQRQRLPDDDAQLGVAKLLHRQFERADHGHPIMNATSGLRSDDAGGLQLGDLLGREAAFAQDLVGVLATPGRGALHAFLGAREARCSGGLCEAGHIDIGVACLGVGVVWRFLHREDRCEADVGAFHDLAPFVACPGLEDGAQPLLELAPGLAVHLRRQRQLVLQARLLEQQRVELRLDRADADMLAVLRLIGAIEVRAAVECCSPAGRSKGRRRPCRRFRPAAGPRRRPWPRRPPAPCRSAGPRAGRTPCRRPAACRRRRNRPRG